MKFEWPSADLLQSKPAIKLNQLTFKSKNKYVSSVQCIMSDSSESQVFEKSLTENEQHEDAKTIDFEGKIDLVRSITATEVREETSATRLKRVIGGVYKILFYKNMKTMLQENCQYNPYKEQKQGTRRSLNDNEELIGVYGTYEGSVEADAFFKSFGFIVKVKASSAN